MSAAPLVTRGSSALQITITAAAFAVAAIAAAQTAGGYADQVTEWRRKFDADLIAEGWLSVVGRERVPEGTSSLGSAPDSTIVLPASAPRQLGQLVRRGDAIDFIPAPNSVVSIDGRPAAARVQIPPAGGAGEIKAGSLSLAVRRIAGDFYLSIQDSNSPAYAAFKGTAWFPVDPAYRVSARFVPYDKPREVELALTFESETKTFTSPGDVTFELDGKPLRLQTFVDGEELFLIFQDETNGTETYGGGRYLSAPLPKDGLTTLDFNKAINPYCAVNPYVICALTPPRNRLPVRIGAGARFTK